MDPVSWQYERLLSIGRLPRPVLDSAFAAARGRPGADLAGILCEQGHLTELEREQLRDACAGETGALFHTVRESASSHGPLPSSGVPGADSAALVSSAISSFGASGGPGVSRDAPAPDEFPGFEVLEELGRGGMGVVYRGRERASGRPVAIKMIKSRAGDEVALLRFEKEARVLAEIRHPSVVRVLQFGRGAAGPWFAMDLVEGRPLDELIEDSLRETGEGLAAERARAIMTPVAEALLACHAAGFVHRDLKPQNIIIQPDGRPKLLDFGLVKYTGDSRQSLAEELTRSVDLLGTPSFMAPEQADPTDFGKPGPACDVWAIGATLFAMVTGRPLYQGAPASVIATLLTRPVPRIADHRSDLPEDLAALIDACLVKPQRDRPTMEQVVAALRGEDLVEAVERVSPRTLAKRGLAIACVVLTGLALWLTRTPPARRFLRFQVRYAGPDGNPVKAGQEDDLWLVHRRRVTILGQADSGPCPVRVGDRRVTSQANGAFVVTLKLDAGETAIPISAEDARATLRICVDEQPPVITLDDPSIASGLFGDRAELTGAVDDLGLESLTLGDGTPVEVLPPVEGSPPGRHRFKARLPESGRAGSTLATVDRFALIAKDKVGNVTRIEAPRITTLTMPTLFKRLESPETWLAAEPKLRELVCRVVLWNLGSEWEFLELREFSLTLNTAPPGREPRTLRNVVGCYRHRKTGLVFHLIPGGRFLMGSKSSKEEESWWEQRGIYVHDPSRHLNSPPGTAKSVNEGTFINRFHAECPAHGQTVPPLLVSRTETPWRAWLEGGGEIYDPARLRRLAEGDSDETNARYLRGLAGWAERTRPSWSGPDKPVVWVPLAEIESWITTVGGGVRLPSEVEWEYACRAGSTTRFFWGDAFDQSYLWSRPVPKRRIMPSVCPRSVSEHWAAGKWNAFGLVDMLGNVVEWSADDFRLTYETPPPDHRPWKAGDDDENLGYRAHRGGGINTMACFCRSAMRIGNLPTVQKLSLGFRLVRPFPEPRP